MKIDVHMNVYLRPLEDGSEVIINHLVAIRRMLTESKKREIAMSVELDALTVKVQETTTVAQSAITLINGLAAQIADLKDDPAALQALADSLGASSTALAAAITANTPQA